MIQNIPYLYEDSECTSQTSAPMTVDNDYDLYIVYLQLHKHSMFMIAVASTLITAFNTWNI